MWSMRLSQDTQRVFSFTGLSSSLFEVRNFRSLAFKHWWATEIVTRHLRVNDNFDSSKFCELTFKRRISIDLVFFEKSSCMWLKLLIRSWFPGPNVSHCKPPEEKYGGLKPRSRRVGWIKIPTKIHSALNSIQAFQWQFECSLKEQADDWSFRWADRTKTCLKRWLILSFFFLWYWPRIELSYSKGHHTNCKNKTHH